MDVSFFTHTTHLEIALVRVHFITLGDLLHIARLKISVPSFITLVTESERKGPGVSKNLNLLQFKKLGITRIA
eukprot:gene30883-40193_t